MAETVPGQPSATSDPTLPNQKRAWTGPSLNQIYAQPAPIKTFPLPTFYPNNPISLFHIGYAWLGQLLSPPAQEPAIIHQGTWSAATSSVHITDEKSVRALWEQGFYGKGSLSRSEPNWLKRELVRRGQKEAHVSEIFTVKRRDERIRAKWERARLEQEMIKETRKQELLQAEKAKSASSNAAPISLLMTAPTGPLEILALPNSHADLVPLNAVTLNGHVPDQVELNGTANSQESGPRIIPGLHLLIEKQSLRPSQVNDLTVEGSSTPGAQEQEATDTTPKAPLVIVDKEHLQLMPEEALWLTFGLGVLKIKDPESGEILSTQQLLRLFRQYSYFPPRVSPDDPELQPDDEFLLHYAIYHHFRSLGWVPRAGIKFGVDWLLYTRGPVFDHAQFGLIVVPSYSDPWWKASGKASPQKTWAWLHSIVRSLSQVYKSLVWVYVDVPPPAKFNEALDKGLVDALKLYKVREFPVKRWSPNRNR